MTEDTLLSFDLPAASCNTMTGDFAGRPISSHSGEVRLCAVERRLGLAEMLVGCMWEWDDAAPVVRTLPAM